MPHIFGVYFYMFVLFRILLFGRFFFSRYSTSLIVVITCSTSMPIRSMGRKKISYSKSRKSEEKTETKPEEMIAGYKQIPFCISPNLIWYSALVTLLANERQTFSLNMSKYNPIWRWNQENYCISRWILFISIINAQVSFPLCVYGVQCIFEHIFLRTKQMRYNWLWWLDEA